MKNKKADWSKFKNRATWSYVSSRELSEIMGVSLQSINNWKMRYLLPEPVTSFKGNKNYYKISAIRAMLEDRSEDDIHWEWIRQKIPCGEDMDSIGQAQFVLKSCWRSLGLEKPKD